MFIDIRQRHGLDLVKLALSTGNKIVLNILLDEENAHAFLAIILDFVEISAE